MQQRPPSAITARVIRPPDTEPVENDWLTYSRAEKDRGGLDFDKGVPEVECH